MTSFRLKLVVYFLLLSLLPLAAAFSGFAAVAKRSETRLVDARLQAGLPAALAAHEERLSAADPPAPAPPRSPAFPRPPPAPRPPAPAPRGERPAGHAG